MPLESSLESPLPVRTVARAIGSWIARLGRIWVEGQVTELSRRPGMGTVFLTLRDPAAEVSLRVTCSRALCDALGPQLGEGARVVVWARPEFQLARGTLTLTAYDVRPIGIGELLLRLERLKSVLAAEGLFAAERKRSLPFLPAGIGLVTGRGSAASRDIQENAVRRWPAVRFTVREVPVQGPAAAAAVAEAMRELDHDSSVDVIVVARGGGSVEDLLPFSDEHLLRTAAALSKPLVSAIGHEQDAPLLDLVSDVRASTPTDAAKRLVPDLGEQVQHIGLLRRRARRCVTYTLDRETAVLAALRSRPVLADPARDVRRRSEEVAALRARSHRCLQHRLEAAGADLARAVAHVRAVSPAATLARGYAVVQDQAGTLVRDCTAVSVGQPLDIRLAAGRMSVDVTRTIPAPAPLAPATETSAGAPSPD
ncbi:MAG: exodeoxyribonuclease VII large subunit [Frankiaceae bacterium]